MAERYRAARHADDDFSRRFVSTSSDVAPEPYTLESLARRKQLRADTDAKKQAYETAARELYGIY